MSTTRSGFVAATLAVVAISAAPVRDSAAGTATLVEAVRMRIETAFLAPAATVGGERLHTLATLVQLYERRGFRPAWVAGNRPSPEAHELSATILRAADSGLDPSHYHAAVIVDLLGGAVAAADNGASVAPGPLADLDLLLSDAFLLLGTHLVRGHVNPETIDAEWFAERREADVAAALETAAGGAGVATVLSGLEPPQAGYGRLKEALSRYRDLADWPPVPEGPTLRVGDRSDRVPPLRARLAATGDLSPGDLSSPELDEEVAAAVRGFQERHGLDVDGVVGRKTLAELDRTRADRIRQIEVNLERWRWLPQQLGRRHVMVNVAGYDLWLEEDGVPTLEMRVIVGRNQRRTPVFSDQISYMVLNPSWSIPPKLAVEDKLPLIRRDPSFLAKQGIRVFAGWSADAAEIDPATVEWGAVTARSFPFRLRQDPGPLNALGRIKFMFPNRHSIYLHDTPSRELFARSDRDFSSGCIRIERPAELAEALLASDPSWSPARLREALATGAEQTVRLPAPVPVHLQYWTSWVHDGGTVHFRRDLYGRDDRLAAELHQPPPAVPVAAAPTL